jgi:hypothetical protein
VCAETVRVRLQTIRRARLAGLLPSPDDYRCVLAVVTYLDAQ